MGRDRQQWGFLPDRAGRRRGMRRVVFPGNDPSISSPKAWLELLLEREEMCDGERGWGAGSGTRGGSQPACPSYPTFPGWETGLVHLHWDLSPVAGPAQCCLASSSNLCRVSRGGPVGQPRDWSPSPVPHQASIFLASATIPVCPPILQQQSTGREFNSLDLSLFATVNIHGRHELVLYPLGIIQWDIIPLVDNIWGYGKIC